MMETVGSSKICLNVYKTLLRHISENRSLKMSYCKEWLYDLPTWGKLRTVFAVCVCLPGKGSAEVSSSNPVCFRYSSNMASGTTTLEGRGLRLNPNIDSRLASTLARTSEFSLRLLLVADLELKEEHAGWWRVASSTGRTISNPRIVAHTPVTDRENGYLTRGLKSWAFPILLRGAKAVSPQGHPGISSWGCRCFSPAL
jgi:hypothetical protein